MAGLRTMKGAFLFTLLIVFPATQGLEWTADTAQQTSVRVCRGGTLILDWAYLLQQAETVQDIHWDFASAQNQEIIAMEVQGHFNVMPTFAGRVSHHGNASLELRNMQFVDAGNYSVEVNAHTGQHGAGTFTVLHHTAIVVVAEPPTTHNTGLTVQQSREAVYDVTTGKYHVQLTCGKLSDAGSPPVDVIWQTPSGSQEASTREENGTFYLQLENPIEGGNYTCGLPPSAPSTQCLPADSPLRKNAVVHVDEVLARLSLLEAREDALRTTNNLLKDENLLLKTELKQTRAELNQELHQTKAELNQTKLTLTQTAAQLQQSLTVVTSRMDQYHQDTLNLTHVLQQYTSSRRIAFTARTPSPDHSPTGTVVKFQTVYLNEGNAYNPNTGEFTAPVEGLYVFMVTTSACGSGEYSDYYVTVNGARVAWADSKYTDYFNPASQHIVAHLLSGHKVWIQVINQNGCFVDFSTFSGFLLTQY